MNAPLRHPTGVLLISVPKSGTMFLSRCLEKVSGIPAVFGLSPKSQKEIEADLDPWHPSVRAALAKDSPPDALLAKRYSQYMARNRDKANPIEIGPSFVSDHGMRSFVRFIANPDPNDIQDPESLIAWAQGHRLQLVYLYRDIKAVANSLVHFLADGKSRLMRVADVVTAAELTCDLYAPILAEQMKRWSYYLEHPNVMAIRFEDLISDPEPHIARICSASGLELHDALSIQSARSQPSWTYRTNQGPRWNNTFSQSQQAVLTNLEARK